MIKTPIIAKVGSDIEPTFFMQFFVKKGELSEAKTDLLIVNIFEDQKEVKGATASIDKAMGGLLSAVIKEDHFEGKLGATLLVRPSNNLLFKRVLLVGLGKKKDFSEEKIREVSAVAFREAKKLQVKNITSILHGAGNGRLPAKLCAKAIVEGVMLAAYDFNKHKSEKKKLDPEVFEIVTNDAHHVREALKGITLGEIYSLATIRTRELVNEPASHMRPIDLVNAAKTVATASKGKIKIKIFDHAALTRMGANGILSVARGSDHEPFMVHLTYKPAGAKKRIAFVGKGLTFDSGGISLKPSEHMMTMKCDMAGAAAVIGAFSAFTQLNPKIEIHGIFAACENMPSGKALVPGDVVQTLSKKTVEILNTDAEGRVTLADTLFYAGKLKPALIIDIATLTGSCLSALGEEVAGVMGNHPELTQKLLTAANTAGERAWELPLEESYKQLIKSEVADLKNIGGKYGGVLTAGLFLQEFVGETPWIHMDIAGPAFAERPFNAYTKLGGTGFGVRTILEYLNN
ncbi:MAG: leucyl aminopeptidase [Patescibacteria group bacterium]